VETEYTSQFDIPPVLVLWAYAKKFLGLLAFYLVLKFFWGEYMLLDFGDLKGTGSVSLADLKHIWWFGVWALVLGAFAAAIKFNSEYVPNRTTAVLRGLWLSVNAGVWEELIYRWLLFVTSMVVLPFFNFITFGLVKWLFTECFIPVVNWVTFHSLETQLHFGPWFFGAALVSAAADFRKAHVHLDWIGRLNSWFGGLALFYIMFHYGLFVAIVAHVVYDVIVFTLAAAAAESGEDRELAFW
jgi:hypothetical protein